jgi:colicin import membrane protein
MKGIADPYAYGLSEVEGDRKTLLLTFFVSSICHLLLFAILIFYPDRAWDRKPPLSFINVSIVTLPTLEKGPQPVARPSIQTKRQPSTQNKQPPSKTTHKAISVATKKSPEAISVSTKTKKAKRSLKKKTFKTAEVVKSAIDKIEKRVEASRPDQLTKAIDRLRDQVKNKETAGPKRNQEETASAALEGTGGKRVLELVDLYRVEIAYQVQKNWAFSEQLAGGQMDLVAELAFTVMPNGEIRDIWFDKRSGNKYLDDSAKKAIMKSNPVRPHPGGIRKPYVNVGLRFTPKGVE